MLADVCAYVLADNEVIECLTGAGAQNGDSDRCDWVVVDRDSTSPSRGNRSDPISIYSGKITPKIILEPLHGCTVLVRVTFCVVLFYISWWL